MGDLYLSKGMNRQALESLQKAWGLHPGAAKVAQQIGEDFQKLGKADLAGECFIEARRLSRAENNLSVETGVPGQPGR
ncbi:MAG TPA: tetratricopeptide repeat protein, partial [bacterium]|nr:tetratricopeptide repeat protein [bacterium]